MDPMDEDNDLTDYPPLEHMISSIHTDLDQITKLINEMFMTIERLKNYIKILKKPNTTILPGALEALDALSNPPPNLFKNIETMIGTQEAYLAQLQETQAQLQTEALLQATTAEAQKETTETQKFLNKILN